MSAPLITNLTKYEAVQEEGEGERLSILVLHASTGGTKRKVMIERLYAKISLTGYYCKMGSSSELPIHTWDLQPQDPYKEGCKKKRSIEINLGIENVDQYYTTVEGSEASTDIQIKGIEISTALIVQDGEDNGSAETLTDSRNF